MIKIKLDIVDIINSYLKACNEVVDSRRSIIIVNEYIKNIIHHYKYNLGLYFLYYIVAKY